MHALVISISLIVHSLFLTIFLRCLQNNLSRPRIKELLHSLMALISSSFEEETHYITSLLGISFSKLILIWWFWAELKNLYKVSQRLTVILDGFNSWKFSFLDPVHKLPRAIIFVGNFVNSFIKKKVIFCLLDYSFESFPVFQLFGLLICIKIPITIIIPPSFGVLHDIGFLGIFMLYSIDIISEQLNNFFKSSNILNKVCFETLDKIYQLINKITFLFTILDKRIFCFLYMFLKYWNVNSDRSMVWC